MTLRLSSAVYNPAELPPEDLAATFVGRDHLLEQLARAVAGQSESDSIQHYLLLGPRGIGKTTLLLMLYRRVKADPALSARWLAVRFREEEFYVSSLRDLVALALESLSREEGVVEAARMLDEVEAEGDDARSLAVGLDGLRRICANRKQRLLLLIDNLDLVLLGSRSAAEDQRSLRKRLITESFLMVVGTSTRQFEEIFAYDDAFFNFFSPIGVENLDNAQVEELLLTRARLEGCRDFLERYDDSRGKVRAITFLTGGNPRLVVMLYEILSRHRILPVVQALRETIDKLTPLLKDILEDMPRQQSKILDALMRLDGVGSPRQIAELARLPLNAVTAQLGRLKDTRLVESEGEGRGRPATYRVRDPMFRTWYQMRYLRPARRRVEVFVEFLRAWYSLPDRLALLDGFRKDLATSAGLHRRVAEIALTMDTFAASIEELPARASLTREVAWAYLEAGQTHEAALSLSELQGVRDGPDARREAGGYAALSGLLLERGDAGRAIQALTESLAHDPANLQVRHDLGVALGKTGNSVGAIAAFDAVVDGARADIRLLTSALVNRGAAKGSLGDREGEVADYTAVVELEGAPAGAVSRALHQRGLALEGLGRPDEAVSDLRRCVERGTTARVDDALTDLVRILSQTGRIDEAKSWVERMGDLEPADMPVERRLEARIALVVTLSRSTSPDLAEVLLGTILATSPEEVRERLRFLGPGLALARGGDEAVLAKLPQEEQRIAREIAAQLGAAHGA